jgi:hypothetical protein
MNLRSTDRGFALELTYEEVKALRGQLGDLPQAKTGRRLRLVELYRLLEARLKLSGSYDDRPPRRPPRVKLRAVPKPAPETVDPRPDGKNPAAVALGRLGGLKGGPARAEKLQTARRAEIAQQAARARWDR